MKFTEYLTARADSAKQFILLVVLALLIGFAPTVSAQQAVNASFINGAYLNIDAKTTNTVPIGSIYPWTFGGVGYTNSWWYASKFVLTNTAVTITNASNGLIINAYTSTYLPVYITNGAAFTDITLWGGDANTVPLVNCTVAYSSQDGTNTTIAPIFTLTTLAPLSSDGPGINLPSLPSSSTQNAFTFTGPTVNGTNIVSLSTNCPTTWLQGAHRVRLTVANPVNGTNGALNIMGVWLRGYRAQPAL